MTDEEAAEYYYNREAERQFYAEEEHQYMLEQMRLDQKERDFDQIARWLDEYGLGPVNNALLKRGFEIKISRKRPEKD